MNSKQISETKDENRHLMSLLTVLLAAVSQQFIHILLLRKLGAEKLASRIREIDDNDFKNAMQIIDLLVSRGVSIEIDKHVVSPGLSVPSILRSEHKMELSLHEITKRTRVSSPEGKARVTRTMMLRGKYYDWLTKEIEFHQEVSGSDTNNSEKPELFSLLLRLMEQTLVHAFFGWHNDDTKAADTAWQMSGAAMLYLTALAKYCGSDTSDSGGISIPRSVMSGAADLFQSDINLVRECAGAARHLERETDNPTLSKLCERIVVDLDSISQTQRGNPIEASLGTSEVFRVFARARNRMNS